MTDKKILAELKKCYEYLYDIRENADEKQIEYSTKCNLHRICEQLDIIYGTLFQKMTKSNCFLDIKIKEHDELVIPDAIECDYYDKTTNDFVNKDMVIIDGKEYEWWNDEEFIHEM